MAVIEPTVVVIGAGFGGIATALELRRRGIHRIIVLERAAGPGGVWQANQYPGARCDNPSALYSLARHRFSWRGRYGDRAEIERYLSEVVSGTGLDDCIRYGQTVVAARFRDESSDWEIRTAQGELFRADYLISAVGQLAEPRLPELPGQGEFRGPQFHSARWPDAFEVNGQRIGVVGTGASAAQIVPWLQRHAESVAVFQRNPPWVLPKADVRYSRGRAALMAWRPVRVVERAIVYALCELLVLAVTSSPAGSRRVARAARDHLHNQVADPVLRRTLTPDYPLGGKRCVFSDEYYPALAAANCEVVTDGIKAVTSTGIATEAGEQLDLDAIVYCTGFAVTDFLATVEVHGRDGKSLADHWAPGAKAYLGVTTSGFPNLFFVAGPNTNLTFGSVVFMLERQARYIGRLLSTAARHGNATVEIRPEAEQAFADWLLARFAGSVWSRVISPYRDRHGNVSSLWPRTMTRYWWSTRRPRVADFHPVRQRAPERVVS
ncbi:flavin-containing monooxygenase [Nocardia asteroides]|uniref:flavin-containing monooxygenase n=1 Tax=Nocardia asteroides TaxID=1824 RepID=UPI00364BDEEC